MKARGVIEINHGLYGLYMDYIWIIYGLYMDYIWINYGYNVINILSMGEFQDPIDGGT